MPVHPVEAGPTGEKELFEYQPLAEGELRLLRFNAGNSLSCELVHFDLQHAPMYYALSYTWGNPESYRSITVNETALPIAYNLWTALHAIGSHIREQSACLWVDAVCINEQNLEERSAQVMLMRSIYAQAKRVVVWLGKHSDDSENVMDRMTEFHSKIIDKDGLSTFDGLITNLMETKSEFYGPPGSPCYKSWQAISKFMTRPWFFRAWVVQEASAQNDKTVFCGNRSIEWRHLHSTFVVAHVLSHHAKLYVDETFLSGFTALESFTKRRKQKTKCLLLDLCGDFRMCDTTDPRDKIYALAGLASDLCKGELVPDYSKTFTDVYRDLVVYSLSNSLSHHELDFLGFVSRPEIDFDGFAGEVHVLPSWVPDWRIRTYAFPFCKKRIDQSQDKICGKVYDASRASSFDGFILNQELHLKGFVVDRMRHLSTICKTGKGSLAESDDEFLRSWLPLNAADLYRNSETVEQAFLSTVTADIINNDGSNDDDVFPTRPHKFEWTAKRSMRRSSNSYQIARHARAVILAMNRATYGRRFMWTSKGFMGLAPAASAIGDKICNFFGGQVLYVLREREEGKQEFIGECYVHGLMDGEAFDEEGKYLESVKEFVLV